jgi:hypothetical protein
MSRRRNISTALVRPGKKGIMGKARGKGAVVPRQAGKTALLPACLEKVRNGLFQHPARSGTEA